MDSWCSSHVVTFVSAVCLAEQSQMVSRKGLGCSTVCTSGLGFDRLREELVMSLFSLRCSGSVVGFVVQQGFQRACMELLNSAT